MPTKSRAPEQKKPRRSTVLTVLDIGSTKTAFISPAVNNTTAAWTVNMVPMVKIP